MEKKRNIANIFCIGFLAFSFHLAFPLIPLRNTSRNPRLSQALFHNGVTSSYFFYYLRYIFFCFYGCSVIPNRLKVKEQSSVFIVFISLVSNTVPEKQQLLNAKLLTFIQFSHYVSASACLQPSQSTY